MSDAPSSRPEQSQGAIESFEVPNALEGERIDRALSLLFDWTRSEAQRLVADGEVLVDDEVVPKSHRLRAGEELVVLGAPRSPTRPAPQDLDVDVRHADSDVIVVAKPAGLVVHPGAGHDDGTLVNGLLARFPEIAEVGDPQRPGIVHRLDKDTSGLLIVARSVEAYGALVAALKTGSVSRTYDALVWGELDVGRGVIDAPIGRSAHRRTRMAVRESGKPARTRYEVVEVLDVPRTSRLRLELETGRTHQIRVHCAAIGNPVVGDATYGGRRDSVVLERPFLHATSLAFVHPSTGLRVEFTDPLPADLAEVLANLRSGAR